MKTCTRCKKNLPEVMFGANPKAKDGLAYWCKSCHREYANNYQKAKRIKKRLLAPVSAASEPITVKEELEVINDEINVEDSSVPEGFAFPEPMPGNEPDALKRWCSRSFETAVHEGIVGFPTKCPTCGRSDTLIPVHPRFDSPLEVAWLCRACLSRVDAK
jgi:hypothetical protein